MKYFNKKDYTTLAISNQMYEKWVGQNPKEQDKVPTYADFKNIYESIINGYVEAVVYNAHGVNLPYYMGEISTKYITSINGYFRRQIKTDLVPFVNLGTNGKVAKILFVIKNARRFNWILPYVAFQPAKPLKDLANISIVDNPDAYLYTSVVGHNIKRIRNKYIKKIKLQEYFEKGDSIAEDVLY